MTQNRTRSIIKSKNNNSNNYITKVYLVKCLPSSNE